MLCNHFFCFEFSSAPSSGLFLPPTTLAFSASSIPPSSESDPISSSSSESVSSSASESASSSASEYVSSSISETISFLFVVLVFFGFSEPLLP